MPRPPQRLAPASMQTTGPVGNHFSRRSAILTGRRPRQPTLVTIPPLGMLEIARHIPKPSSRPSSMLTRDHEVRRNGLPRESSDVDWNLKALGEQELGVTASAPRQLLQQRWHAVDINCTV
jgi:hypothetical protein